MTIKNSLNLRRFGGREKGRQWMETRTQNRAKDPVCGMDVDLGETSLGTQHEGRDYYFCGRSCLDAFEKNPGKYLKPKGVVGRFIERLARSNREEFGRGARLAIKRYLTWSLTCQLLGSKQVFHCLDLSGGLPRRR
jgi:YHS domain-containing protein